MTSEYNSDMSVFGGKDYIDPDVLKSNGFDAVKLKAAGYSLAALKSCCFSVEELVAAGFTSIELRCAGIGPDGTGITTSPLPTGPASPVELSIVISTFAVISGRDRA